MEPQPMKGSRLEFSAFRFVSARQARNAPCPQPFCLFIKHASASASLPLFCSVTIHSRAGRHVQVEAVGRRGRVKVV
jgi:hypothetical protein